MQDRRREQSVGRVGTVVAAGALSTAVQNCREHQSTAPPQTTAAGLPLQLRGKPHTEIYIYTGRQSATSQDHETEDKTKRRRGKEPSDKYGEEVRRTGHGPLLFFFGRTELPEIFTLYFWRPFNNLPSASCWSVEHDFAFLKVLDTDLCFYFQSTFLPI